VIYFFFFFDFEFFFFPPFLSWWHILTGCSSYALVLFSVVVRQRILGYDAALGFHFGCIPYIISKTRMRAPVKGQ